MAKVKSKAGWLVAYPHDKEPKIFRLLYDGPDRAVARQKVENALASGVPSVIVQRVTRRIVLSKGSLVSMLPRKSF